MTRYPKTPLQLAADRLYRRARRAAGLERPTDELRARWRAKSKARYWRLRGTELPRYTHRHHDCSSCGRPGHNARTCAIAREP